MNIKTHSTPQMFGNLLKTLVICAAAILLLLSPNLLTADQSSDELLIIATPIEGKDPSERVGPVRLSNMTVLQALDLLREFSGRVIIPSDNLPGTRLHFNSGVALPRREAIYALENLLSLNGVNIRLLDNGFVSASSAAHPQRQAVPLLQTLPSDGNSNQVFSKIFSFEFLSSNNMFSRLRGLVSTGNRANIQHLPESNAVLITDSLANLRRFEQIIEEMDRPDETRLELIMIPVTHGSPWNIRSNLLQMLRSQMRNRLRDTTIFADSRTNILWIITHPSNREFFETIVEELDQEIAPFTTTEVMNIENANFWNVWGIVNGIIRTQQAQFRRQSFRSPETTVASSPTRRLTPSELDEMEGGEGEDVGDTLPAVVEAVDDSNPDVIMIEDASPELQFSPYIAIFADRSNESIIVYGTQNDIRRMRALIQQLDIRSPAYVQTDVIDIIYAQSDDIRNIVNFTINQQQRAFSRQGLRTGVDQEGDSISLDSFEFSPFVALVSNRRNNTLVIQGTRQDLDQIRNLVSKLDVEAVPTTVNEVLYLDHADAATLGRIIQNIINNQRNIFRRARMRTRADRREDEDFSLNNVEEAASLGFEFSQYAVVNADRRTNALFVFGTLQDVARVKEIVRDADIVVEPMTSTRIFNLTHSEANRTASVVNQLIGRQNRALRQLRSEGRVQAERATVAGESDAGTVEGEEALQFSPFISVLPDTRSNSIIVYGTRGDHTQVRNLLGEIDIEVAPFTRTEVFLLENTQAGPLFGVLNNLVRGQERALRRVRSSIMEIRNIRPDDDSIVDAELTLDGLQFSPFVTITPNARNNSIIVFGTDSDIRQLGTLIEASDIKIAPRTQSRTFFIRHANATDVSRTITNLIRQQQRVREREATLTRVFRRGAEAEGMDADSMDEFERDFDVGDILEERTTESFSDIFSFDEDMQFSPYISLVADTRSNSVLAYGTAFDLEQVSALIEQIDQVLTQVRIEVVIAEVTLTGDQVSGLESFGINFRNPFGFQEGATVDGDIGIQGQQPGIGASGRPSMDLGMTLSDFSLNAVFRTARQDSMVKVLSAPSITTTHNRMATINVGEARPVITASASNLASNNLVTRSEIEFRDIGITLRVRPLVGDDSYIQMDLEQIVETVIDTQTIDGNVQPIIGTRRANSFVSVRDQEVIVMGGLQSVDTTTREGRVAVLGSVPIFGGLFRPTSEVQTVRELVIFIQPIVVQGSPRADFIQENQMDDSLVAPTVDNFIQSGSFLESDQIIERARDRGIIPPSIRMPDEASEEVPPAREAEQIEAQPASPQPEQRQDPPPPAPTQEESTPAPTPAPTVSEHVNQEDEEDDEDTRPQRRLGPRR